MIGRNFFAAEKSGPVLKLTTDVSNETHSIEGVNTSITAFIGLAKKGPTNKPIKIISSVEFERIALKYCESRRAFLIIDPPLDWIKNNTRKLPSVYQLEKILGNLSQPNAALYYPHVRAKERLDDNMRKFVPSGAVAGIIARTDSTVGVWKAPAGLDAYLTGLSELELTLIDEEIGKLNESGVNCLRTVPARGIVVWGSRTLVKKDINSEPLRFWKYVPVRRFALFIEESLYRGTQWVIFEPNDEPLWSEIRLKVGNFMHDLFMKKAFQGNNSRKAYFVKCDSETTTQVDIDNGIVNIIVGFAPLKPAEFVIIKIQQSAGKNSNRLRKIYHGRKNRK